MRVGRSHQTRHHAGRIVQHPTAPTRAGGHGIIAPSGRSTITTKQPKRDGSSSRDPVIDRGRPIPWNISDTTITHHPPCPCDSYRGNRRDTAGVDRPVRRLLRPPREPTGVVADTLGWYIAPTAPPRRPCAATIRSVRMVGCHHPARTSCLAPRRGQAVGVSRPSVTTA